MFPLRCTVRNCPCLLQKRDRSLVCDAGHNFDQAKHGYWNLTQPQDKKSTNPGDNDDAVMARHRWLARDIMSGFVDELRAWTKDLHASARVLDLGCGEGTFGYSLFSSHAACYCGIDLSRKALRLASKRWPETTWVLANADRTLPAEDSSVDCLLSLFGRRPVNEISRVLSTEGICVVAIPAEDDFIELRELVQGSGERRSRWESVVSELEKARLQLIEHKTWRVKVDLSPDAIRDALDMTYRGARYSQQQRLANVQTMQVTLGAELLLFRPAE